MTTSLQSDATAVEVNFDGLVGPSHNYGGMSAGNLASSINEGEVSNPKEAALQGLEKARLLLSARRVAAFAKA